MYSERMILQLASAIFKLSRATTNRRTLDDVRRAWAHIQECKSALNIETYLYTPYLDKSALEAVFELADLYYEGDDTEPAWVENTTELLSYLETKMLDYGWSRVELENG